MVVAADGVDVEARRVASRRRRWRDTRDEGIDAEVEADDAARKRRKRSGRPNGWRWVKILRVTPRNKGVRRRHHRSLGQAESKLVDAEGRK